ncbi:GNAT family N-acetyltransferase [Pseudoalteromonas sp. T1lg10]|uniref:GNAT family N-acetyltransferase n=1 Tax=Pseudoalteromonas sp. T1lg10 TaxID=2077093 RepID=UPI000CF686A2|nr:GNAT family N-acetyltransferase [Pseudoalteromonas sp. T1lg10]
MEVRFMSQGDLQDKVLDVLLQLRPQYSRESLHVQIEKQKAQGYQLVYVISEGEVLAVAGFSIGEKLAWGKHIYIEDLVTNEAYRSKGVGTFFMNWFKSYAKKVGCTQIHLDSGVQRFPAHKFYLREGFRIASHHFSIVEGLD